MASIDWAHGRLWVQTAAIQSPCSMETRPACTCPGYPTRPGQPLADHPLPARAAIPPRRMRPAQPVPHHSMRSIGYPARNDGQEAILFEVLLAAMEILEQKPIAADTGGDFAVPEDRRHC